MARLLFGYEIESDYPLTRPRSGIADRGCLTLRASTESILDRRAELISWAERDEAQFALASCAEGLIAWCNGTGSYLIDAGRGRISAEPAGLRSAWEHRIGATIVPLLLSERGELVLHAAAIECDGHAVIFCGPSGRGKSTLSAALALRGHRILTDDGVVVSGCDRRPTVWPGQAGIRVHPDAVDALRGEPRRNGGGYKDVEFLESSLAESVGPLPVGAVVVLGPRGDAGALAERIEPATALPAVMPHVLYAGRSRLKRALRRTAQLVERVPVFYAQLRDDLASAGEQAAQILDAAVQDEPAPAPGTLITETRYSADDARGQRRADPQHLRDRLGLGRRATARPLDVGGRRSVGGRGARLA